MEAIRNSLQDLTQEDMTYLGITRSDLGLTRSELKTLMNRWQHLEHLNIKFREKRFGQLEKCKFLLGENIDGTPLTAKQKAKLKIKLELLESKPTKWPVANLRTHIDTFPPNRPPASAGASPQMQHMPIGLKATDLRNTDQLTSSIHSSPSSARSNSIPSGIKKWSPVTDLSKSIETYPPARPPASAGASPQMQHNQFGLNATDSRNTDQRTSSMHSSPSSARSNSIPSGIKKWSPVTDLSKSIETYPPARPPASAGASPQMQHNQFGLNATDSRNTDQLTSSMHSSPSSARSNSIPSGIKKWSPVTDLSKYTETYPPARPQKSAGASQQMQYSQFGLNATDSPNTDQRIHSSPNSARGYRTGSFNSASTSATCHSIPSISDASRGEEIAVHSKPYIRKHRVKLGILGVFMVICIIVIIFGAIYGPRKDDGGEETAIIKTHGVTDVTEDMNSSPTVPMESVRSTQEETERETTQTLGSEPPEASTVATSIETKAKDGTLHPPRKPKRLELLLAILVFSGVAILLIIGAMMMRKMRRGRSRAARYL